MGKNDGFTNINWGGFIFAVFTLAVLFTTGCASTLVHPGGWKYSYSKDAMTDHVREYVYITNTARELGGGKLVRTTIKIGCPRLPFVSFISNSNTLEMLYRIDSQPPVNVTKGILSDGDFSLYLVSAIVGDVREQLINGSRLAIHRRTELTALTQTEHSFDIKHLTEALKSCL